LPSVSTTTAESSNPSSAVADFRSLSSGDIDMNDPGKLSGKPQPWASTSFPCAATVVETVLTTPRTIRTTRVTTKETFQP